MTDMATRKPAGIETTGIEIIAESERTAAPSDLFWPWFAANVSVFGLSYAAFILYFGISFWQGVLVAVVGIVVSFALCGIIAIAGKRGSAPTMILSRAAFGVTGQKLPGVVSWLVSIGWETFLAILAVLATSTIFERLGWGGGTATKIVAAAVVAVLIVSASVAGYHVIMRLQAVLTWVTGAVSIVYVVMTVDDVDWDAVSAIPAGSTQAVIGALVMVMTGFGLGWINIAADWSRYQRRDASNARHRLLEHLRRRARPGAAGVLRPGAGRVVDRDPRRRRRRPHRHARDPAADVVPRAVPAGRRPGPRQRRRARHLLLGAHAALARRTHPAARRRPSSTA